jgi:NAD+ synthase
MRDYAVELKNRVEFIRNVLTESGCGGVVFGNSGGKDSALVGILCKRACENTLGIIMQCESKINFGQDTVDANALASRFNIAVKVVDLTAVKLAQIKALEKEFKLNDGAVNNIAPRLRMLTLYAVAAANNMLVAGTGNRSESYMGYFTKYGDGAYDFNPIIDLTVKEVYEFLEYLNCPPSIIKKAPSAGLFEGQTDESEMGISYAKIDDYLLNGNAHEADKKLIESFHRKTEHKRKPPINYGG